MFLAIIALIHQQSARFTARRNSQPPAPLDVAAVRPFFPDGSSLDDHLRADGGRDVLNENGDALGYVIQTSPQADHVIGFSGPTNTLLAFSRDDAIVGAAILDSGDTRDHVAQVREDSAFLKSFAGMTWDDAARAGDVDAVSGATLTSLAIQESIIHRLGGSRPSLRFPEPLTVADALPLFEMAESVKQDDIYVPLWHVTSHAGDPLGTILRTSPAADNIVGYQGPTEARIGFDPGGRVVGISIGTSFDNEPYVTYVREDEYFLTLFNELVLQDFNASTFDELGVEGVSGATMTSMAVADGLIAAAQQHHQVVTAQPPPARPWITWSARDYGTAAVIVLGLVIALSPWRGNKYLRIGLQLVLIVLPGPDQRRHAIASDARRLGAKRRAVDDRRRVGFADSGGACWFRSRPGATPIARIFAPTGRHNSC